LPFVPGPLNANELQLPTHVGGASRVCVCVCVSVCVLATLITSCKY